MIFFVIGLKNVQIILHIYRSVTGRMHLAISLYVGVTLSSFHPGSVELNPTPTRSSKLYS